MLLEFQMKERVVCPFKRRFLQPTLRGRLQVRRLSQNHQWVEPISVLCISYKGPPLSKQSPRMTSQMDLLYKPSSGNRLLFCINLHKMAWSEAVSFASWFFGNRGKQKVVLKPVGLETPVCHYVVGASVIVFYFGCCVSFVLFHRRNEPTSKCRENRNCVFIFILIQLVS